MYTSCYEMRLRHSKSSEIWIKVNSLWLFVHSLPYCFNYLLYQNDHFLNFEWRKLACLHQRCTKWFRGKNSVRQRYFEFTEIFKSAPKTILGLLSHSCLLHRVSTHWHHSTVHQITFMELQEKVSTLSDQLCLVCLLPKHTWRPHGWARPSGVTSQPHLETAWQPHLPPTQRKQQMLEMIRKQTLGLNPLNYSTEGRCKSSVNRNTQNLPKRFRTVRLF